MKKLKNYYMHLRHHHHHAERRWVFPLAVGSLLSLFLLFVATLTSPEGTPILPFYRSITAASYSVFVESKLHPLPVPSLPPPPRLAYLVSGSAGDGGAVRRVLLALYHPGNRYVVHLDLEASAEERADLARFVEEHPLFRQFGNVRVIKKANLVTYRGPTMVANTLHAAAILLRELGDWDWFINLSASDYPLVTQDARGATGTRLFWSNLDHLFNLGINWYGVVPVYRGINWYKHVRVQPGSTITRFVQICSSLTGYLEFLILVFGDSMRARPIIVDPGLYMNKKQDVFWVTQRRSRPTAFKLFTAIEPIVVLWLIVVELILYDDVMLCIVLLGWHCQNRSLITAYGDGTTYLGPYLCTIQISYLPLKDTSTQNTTVNSDLHFISWDNPPKQHPHYLTVEDMKAMVDSNAPFARKFHRDDPVLDKIDAELLSRGPGMTVPGGWCIGKRENGTDPCSEIGDTTVLRPGQGEEEEGPTGYCGLLDHYFSLALVYMSTMSCVTIFEGSPAFLLSKKKRDKEDDIW
ncbi:hypothetical protein V8G54_012188 [Vigna mungo]|uniref:Uncharacterized protein n=1 Tax=Vigna mungo TaxID=3915 RepID=A0AAQ3NT11_VIGMU